MIANCLRGQDRDMQKFSWNLDNFKFEAGFEPEPINCKSVTLASRPWARDGKPHVMVFFLLGELSRMVRSFIKMENFKFGPGFEPMTYK
jgi:hypothetical protein